MRLSPSRAPRPPAAQEVVERRALRRHAVQATQAAQPLPRLRVDGGPHGHVSTPQSYFLTPTLDGGHVGLGRIAISEIEVGNLLTHLVCSVCV
jgi:hypothetical protein